MLSCCWHEKSSIRYFFSRLLFFSPINVCLSFVLWPFSMSVSETHVTSGWRSDSHWTLSHPHIDTFQTIGINVNRTKADNFLPSIIDKKHFIPHCLDDWSFRTIKIKHTKDLSVKGNTIFHSREKKSNFPRSN